jgi:4'-phosphopantetheinyl transferase EntD
MTMFIDEELQSSLRAFSPAGIVVDHRLIAVGDEHAILPEEARAFERSVIQVRRASGAARIVARALIERHGSAEKVLPKSEWGAPVWPKGIVGSLAHDSRVAIAAVGASKDVGALGIDIEPAEKLPGDLLHLIATPREREAINHDSFHGRLLFVAKEAVYKAVYPLDHIFLDHHDIEVDFANQKATVRNGRIVDLRFCISTHLVTLAFLPAVHA